MKYKVVSDDNIRELEESVNALLEKGWLLFGGIAVSTWCYETRDDGIAIETEYCQAVTLEGEEKPA